MAYTPIYTTVAKVRAESGLTNSTNIGDTRILDAVARSEGEIDAILTTLYTLPLADNNDNWTESAAANYLEGIATDLAVGILWMEQYGVESEGTSKDGKEKLDRIRGNSKKGIVGELEKLAKKIVKLIGSDGAELTSSTVQSPEGWPNNTTEDAEDEDAGGDVNFRISDKY